MQGPLIWEIEHIHSLSNRDQISGVVIVDEKEVHFSITMCWRNLLDIHLELERFLEGEPNCLSEALLRESPEFREKITKNKL